MKRYIVLIASIVIQICLGGVYAWSEFVPVLKSEYNISTTQAQLIFGTTIAVFTFVMILSGRLLDSYGPRRIAFTGGILFGSGYLLSAFSGGNFYLLFLGISIVGGSGIGFGYVCPLATCIKWFPKHKGLITGISVAGFGGGAILLTEFVEHGFHRGMHVLDVFWGMGITYGIVLITSSLFLSEPAHSSRVVKKNSISLHVLTKDINFWMLVSGMFAGTFAGLLIIGNLKPIGLSMGLNSSVAGSGISFFAMGNAAGRILWGKYYDKIGKSSIPLSLMFISISVGALLFLGNSSILFLLTSLLIGIGFGSCFVIYATSVSDIFGFDVLGSVYPLIFLAYGISGILGPVAGGCLFDLTNHYFPAIILSSCLTATSALGCRLLILKNVKTRVF